MINLCMAEYVKNLKRNILIIVLLSAAIVLVFLTLGNFRTSYKYYSAVEEYMGDKGICTADVINASKSVMTKWFNDIDGIDSYKLFGVTFMLVGEEGSKSVYLYDDADAKNLMPDLIEGEWKDSDPDDKSIINVLVSENDSGIKTGDIIDTEYITEDGQLEPVKARVVGVFKNGERIAGYMNFLSMYDVTYKTFFSVFDVEQNEDYIFVSTEKEYGKLREVFLSGSTLGIIRYKDDLTDDEVMQTDRKISELFSDYGGIVLGSVPLKIVKDNSINEIKKLVMQFLPFAIVVLVLSIICTMSTSAVSTLEGLYSYTIYYLTGMKWNGVLKICGFSTICNEVMSGMVSVIIIAVMRMKIPDIAGRINIGALEIGIVLMIWILMYLLSIIMPLSILKNNRPAQLLQQKG